MLIASPCEPSAGRQGLFHRFIRPGLVIATSNQPGHGVLSFSVDGQAGNIKSCIGPVTSFLSPRYRLPSFQSWADILSLMTVILWRACSLTAECFSNQCLE